SPSNLYIIVDFQVYLWVTEYVSVGNELCITVRKVGLVLTSQPVHRTGVIPEVYGRRVSINKILNRRVTVLNVLLLPQFQFRHQALLEGGEGVEHPHDLLLHLQRRDRQCKYTEILHRNTLHRTAGGPRMYCILETRRV